MAERNESDDDTEFNPLIDADESGSEASSADGGSERFVELRQALVHQRDEIDNLKDVIESLKESISSIEEAIERRDQQIDILRNTARRLRFQADSNDARMRRNNTFFDAARRKFLEGWNGDMAIINSADLDHLAFLAHILDLPPTPRNEVRA